MVASILLAHLVDVSCRHITKCSESSDVTSGNSWHVGAITKRAVFSSLPNIGRQFFVVGRVNFISQDVASSFVNPREDDPGPRQVWSSSLRS